MLTCFVGIERQTDDKTLTRSAVLAIIWCIWMESNAKIFQNHNLPNQLLWEKVVFMACL